MDRNRELAAQVVNLQKRIDEQMDLDYARHGMTLIPDDKNQSAALTGSFYGVKADNTGTKLVLASVVVDGVTLSNVDIAAGDVFYGNITSVLIGSGGTCQAIVLHKKGHGATLVSTTD
tara:strand:+ start:150 stop:503 length:354 start_codon:yes stop_codon:yes gene_type:complete